MQTLHLYSVKPKKGIEVTRYIQETPNQNYLIQFVGKNNNEHLIKMIENK